MFMHGIQEFSIVRGDTLTKPILENDKLKKFNVILANPPYSKAWIKDLKKTLMEEIFGEARQLELITLFSNIYIKAIKKWRTAILWPHGILFRNGKNNEGK